MKKNKRKSKRIFRNYQYVYNLFGFYSISIVFIGIGISYLSGGIIFLVILILGSIALTVGICLTVLGAREGKFGKVELSEEGIKFKEKKKMIFIKWEEISDVKLKLGVPNGRGPTMFYITIYANEEEYPFVHDSYHISTYMEYCTNDKIMAKIKRFDEIGDE